MKHRISLPILLMIISVFPVLSQDRGIEILSGIITASGQGNVSASAGSNTPATTPKNTPTPAANNTPTPANAANSATDPTLALPTVMGQVSSGALDLIGITGVNAAPAGVLDYMTTPSGATDIFTDLATSYSRQSADTGLGALDVISNTYSSSGYYMSGVFDNITTDFESNITVIPPVSGMTYYMPQWGRITSGFGYRPQFGRTHKGIDIAMSVGDTVRAALPGIVERVAYEAKGYGHYIIVRHNNGMETRYAHLSLPIASVGQNVIAGQAIGLSGNTGNSTGPHLHFETRVNGVAVDPTTIFNFTSGQQSPFSNTPVAETDPTVMTTGFNGSKKSLLGKSTYVVREGDTPKTIASRAGISVYRLCQLNFIMESQKLQPGTMLKLR